MAKTNLFIDLDDTVVDSTLAYDRAMMAIGIDPQDPKFLEARQLAKARLPALAPQARSRFLYFKAYLEIVGRYRPDRHLELSRGYEEEVVRILLDQWLVLERSDLFRRLREKCRSIYLITNETTRMQVAKLKAFDPAFSLFDGLVTSEEVGVEKPSPIIFQHAMKLADVQDASSVLMAGDSLETDIHPALALGMRAVLSKEFTNDPGETQHDACTSIQYLEELYGFL